MRNCRKWLASLCIIFVILMAAACGGKQKTESVPQEEPSSEAEALKLKASASIIMTISL